MILRLRLPKIRMGGTEKDKHYFIVIKEFTVNRKRIQKGSLGYFNGSETEEFSSAIVECSKQTQKLLQVKQDHLKAIIKDEAELLVEIQDIPRRFALIQDEKLFKSISNININDIVQVRMTRGTGVGIVKNIKYSTRENGLKLRGAVFQVEMVEAEDHKTKARKSVTIIVDAGDITLASNTEVEPPGTNDNESKLHSDDAKDRSKYPAGSPSQQIGLPSGRVENEDSASFLPPISTPDHSKNSSKHYTSSNTPSPVMPGPSSPDDPLAESENPALEVESMVEVRLSNNATVYGVIRWIGTREGYNFRWAGIELDYELKDGNDGTLGKNRYFKCEQNKAIFIPLSRCKPDARFIPSVPKEILNTPIHAAARTVADDLPIKEDVPPVREEEALQLLKGRMKGIQGHYNSCYLDSTIFSLFTFTSVLDSILHMPGEHDEKIQRILREDIVNPLRKTGVVNAEKVTKLRKLLGCDTFISSEKDPEEFINVLLHESLAVDPLLKIRSGEKIQESYCYQIILEKDEKVKVPTVQLLLERSFLSCDLKFEEIPSCLLVQMPRFGKQFKMFAQIMPSLELDITDLLNNTLRQCFICGEVAEYECAQCLLDPILNPGAIKQYCSICNNQVHSHKDRKDHQSRQFPYPRDVSIGPPFPRHKMELFAVLCIETSHYVSFVKYGPSKDSWLFFDSMADRIGDENIPEISDCPQIGDYLMMSEDKLAYTDLKQLDGFAKRLFCDAYMCMYQSPRMGLYK